MAAKPTAQPTPKPQYMASGPKRLAIRYTEGTRSKIRDSTVFTMGNTLSPAPRMALLRVKNTAKST